MNGLPTITEAEVLRFAGSASVAKGRSYARNGAVTRGRLSDRTIRARCRGTRSTPYSVWATFDATGVADAGCSCPAAAEWGGYCKHVAALLLTWIARPADFSQDTDLVDILNRLSQEQLIALVQKCLALHPDLEDIVALSASVQSGVAETPDAATWTRMTTDVFEREGDEWGSDARVAELLQPMVSSGRELRESGRIEEALTALSGIVAAILARSFDWQHGDQGYHIEAVLIDITEEVVEILGLDSTSGAVRAAAIDVLWDLYEASEGYDWSETPWEGLVELTTDEERLALASRAKSKLGTLTGQYDIYRRQRWQDFILDLEGETLDDEQVLARLRDIGRAEAIVGHLLELGRVEEAAAELSKVDTFHLIPILPTLRLAGLNQQAEQLLRTRATSTQDRNARSWLRQQYTAAGDEGALLDMDLADFFEWPRIESYRALRERATKVGRWDEVRSTVVVRLERSGSTHLLIDIALDEQNVERAIKLLDNPANRLFGFDSDVRLRVAMAAEAERWEYSADYYRKCAEDLIERKNASAYRSACEYLVRMRQLYEVNGRAAEWERYIAELRGERPTLKALHRELDALGLAPGI